MLVVVLNMPEHSSFQDMLFPMLFISKYAKSYASIMDISLGTDDTSFIQFVFFLSNHQNFLWRKAALFLSNRCA